MPVDLDAQSAEWLKERFGGISDADMIAELRRRGRLEIITCSEIYWDVMAGDDGYMSAIEDRLMRRMGRTIGESKAYKVEKRDYASPQQGMDRIAESSVVVLLPRKP